MSQLVKLSPCCSELVKRSPRSKAMDRLALYIACAVAGNAAARELRARVGMRSVLVFLVRLG